MEPTERMKNLSMKAAVDIKKNTPAIRYYRSGVELAKMAKIHLSEGDLDRAYVLYLKYIQLFVEKIRQHPEYSQIPEEEKRIVRDNCKKMLSQAEKLKQAILERYKKDYEEWLKIEASKKERLKEFEKQQPGVPIEDNHGASFGEYDPWQDYQVMPQRDGLQKILIPDSLIAKFMQLANNNTSRNIETCGLLTGTMRQDRLTVTVLVIPQQSGTSDDCTAENDLATFNVIESRDLITFGWIHTHPSQDAFLSSVDLHSQFGYQSMLPEAIAIVCAPSDSNQIFRLSNTGMDVIRNCSATGFHPHSGSQLFEIAAHAQLADIPLEVIDIRPKL